MTVLSSEAVTSRPDLGLQGTRGGGGGERGSEGRGVVFGGREFLKEKS